MVFQIIILIFNTRERILTILLDIGEIFTAHSINGFEVLWPIFTISKLLWLLSGIKAGVIDSSGIEKLVRNWLNASIALLAI